MQRDMRRRVLEIITAGAICGLAVTPALAQTDKTGPGQTGGTSNSAGQPNSTGEMKSHEGSMKGHDSSMKNPDSATDTSASSGKRAMGNQSQIRRVQEALKTEGHDPGPIDGMMGPKTQEALRQYQRQENLKETGRLDQDTMSKLGV
jgi:peptidoglycan hydrolase-like protein with peptidoglycan-binding domain